MAPATRGRRAPAPERAPPKKPRQEVLREQLLRWLGGAAVAGETRRVVVRGHHFHLTPVAADGGRAAHLCEWPRSPRLADYHSRRLLHASAGEDAAVVFTDGAGTRQVWGWIRQMPLSAPAYTEEYGRGEAPAGFAAEPEAVEELGLAVDEAAEAAAGAEAVRAVLIARLRREPRVARRMRGTKELPSAVQLQRLVEGARAPDIPRRVWRELTGLRVLDPACGSGGWLMGCLAGLAAVGAACLQWMQAWIEDRPGARADRDADFRRLLTRARELASGGVRDRLVVESVLLRCLYGLEVDAGAAARAAARLAGRLAPYGALVAGADDAEFADVRVGRVVLPGAAAGDRAEPAVAGVGAAPFPARPAAQVWPPASRRRCVEVEALVGEVAAEAEALGRAWEQLVRSRMEVRAPAADVREGREEIRRRRQALTALLLASAARTQDGVPTLHPLIEFHEVLRTGGFHLVRGGAGGPHGGGSPGHD